MIYMQNPLSQCSLGCRGGLQMLRAAGSPPASRRCSRRLQMLPPTPGPPSVQPTTPEASRSVPATQSSVSMGCPEGSAPEKSELQSSDNEELLTEFSMPSQGPFKVFHPSDILLVDASRLLIVKVPKIIRGGAVES